MSVNAFFAYARERYSILLRRRSGAPAPWTDDPILQKYRFCNVFREDDATTKWLRERLTFQNYGSALLGAWVIARWFNRIDTVSRLMSAEGDLLSSWLMSAEGDLLSSWVAPPIHQWKEKVRDRLQGVQPIVTGAYMIKTPAGMSKLEGLLWCLGKILPKAVKMQLLLSLEGTRLYAATGMLSEYPYLGPFMAYEVVTDLRHTPILSNAPDIMYWANPGPGCARGLARVEGVAPYYNRHSARDVKIMLDGMRLLLQYSQNPDLWPSEWPSWEMRDVEHTLCEYDKYWRAVNGERLKRRYVE